MKAFTIFLVLLLSISCFVHLSCSNPCGFNAIFNFGDSLSDTGNYLLSTAGASPSPNIANPPYGSTFFGRPTGRASNGRLIIDFFAEALGLPLLPPYLARGQSFVEGANFAVVGATALDASFFEQRGAGSVVRTNLSLNVQLQWFEQLLPSLCSTPEECRQYLSKSLFLVGEIGGNDYLIPWGFHILTKKQITAYVPTVVEAIKNATERLIKLGAVNLVVPGNPPSGCFAAILTLLNATEKEDFEDGTGCLKSANRLIKYHNRLLRQAVVMLRKKHPGVRIAYADFYTPIVEFVKSPERFGFSYAPLKACCGSGGPYNYNLQAECGLPGSSVCANLSSAINWDGWHATEASYRQIAAAWLHGPFADPPVLSFRSITYSEAMLVQVKSPFLKSMPFAVSQR